MLVVLAIAAGAAAVATVPDPDSDTAVITVSVAGDRDSLTTAAPVAGVTLVLSDTSGGAPLTEPWATCISDTDGDCSFEVPGTGIGGPSVNRQFWVGQSGSPAGWYANPTLASTPYTFTTSAARGGGGTYRSGIDFMTPRRTQANVVTGRSLVTIPRCRHNAASTSRWSSISRGP